MLQQRRNVVTQLPILNLTTVNMLRTNQLMTCVTKYLFGMHNSNSTYLYIHKYATRPQFYLHCELYVVFLDKTLTGDRDEGQASILLTVPDPFMISLAGSVHSISSSWYCELMQ